MFVTYRCRPVISQIVFKVSPWQKLQNDEFWQLFETDTDEFDYVYVTKFARNNKTTLVNSLLYSKVLLKSINNNKSARIYFSINVITYLLYCLIHFPLK